MNALGADQVIPFDNGNMRCAFESSCDSRGQVIRIDAASNTASLSFNGDLGVYASSSGSAQTLSNGDYHFGPANVVPNGTSAAIEVNSANIVEYNLLIDASETRSFRRQNLCTPPTGQ